MTFKCYKCR